MLKRALYSLVATGTAGLAWGLFERRWFVLRHQTVPVLAPHDGVSALRVLHVSDLHLQPGDRGMGRFLRRALAQGPDLVVVTGDILGHADAIPGAVDLLAELVQGRQGVAVLGSNDRYGPKLKNPLAYFREPSRKPDTERLDTDRLVVGLKESGWHVLCNERTLLQTPAGAIDVVGLDDPHIGAASPEQVDWSPPDVPVALRLGVVHSPYVGIVDRFADAGFGLTLAGHTHGGQVRVPGIGALVDNCDLPLRMARGLSTYRRDMWLHVSAGLGTSRYAPVRFACRPEASILDLVPRRHAVGTL